MKTYEFLTSDTGRTAVKGPANQGFVRHRGDPLISETVNSVILSFQSYNPEVIYPAADTIVINPGTDAEVTRAPGFFTVRELFNTINGLFPNVGTTSTPGGNQLTEDELTFIRTLKKEYEA